MKLISMSRSHWIILEICKTLKKLLSWWIRWFYVGFIAIQGLANVIPNRLDVICILLPLISVQILNTFGWSSAVCLHVVFLSHQLKWCLLKVAGYYLDQGCCTPLPSGTKQYFQFQSSEEMYEKNVRRWLVPFLHRCERQKQGSFNALIREYMITMAEADLDRCLKLFESSKADVSTGIRDILKI